MFSRIAVGFALTAVIVANTASAADAPLFPFVIGYDTPDNVTNVAGWLHRPAGTHGFVRADAGRLTTDAGPIRFWATNLCFEACFPDRDQAERLAARLARLGVNCVRMHHMDARSIWGDSPDKLTIDPKQLGRLDYLIHQLKRHGIYTNLNLHVSRGFGPAEGFVAKERRPNYDKGLDNFEPRMVAPAEKVRPGPAHACQSLHQQRLHRRAGGGDGRDQQRERPVCRLELGPARRPARALCHHVSQALEPLVAGEVRP